MTRLRRFRARRSKVSSSSSARGLLRPVCRSSALELDGLEEPDGSKSGVRDLKSRGDVSCLFKSLELPDGIIMCHKLAHLRTAAARNPSSSCRCHVRCICQYIQSALTGLGMITVGRGGTTRAIGPCNPDIIIDPIKETHSGAVVWTKCGRGAVKVQAKCGGKRQIMTSAETSEHKFQLFPAFQLSRRFNITTYQDCR